MTSRASPRRRFDRRRLGLAVLAGLWLFPLATPAAPPNTDPDWPCQQPLVPSVSAAMIWDGPPLDDAADWRSDHDVSALVAAITPRTMSTEEGSAAIDRFLRDHPRNRAISARRAFVGVLEETNNMRARVIENIKMLAERQRGMAEIIGRLSAEKDKAGANPDPELVDRWTFVQRSYYQEQRTIRYACEVPAQLDQRLGAYARVLSAGAGGPPP